MAELKETRELGAALGKVLSGIVAARADGKIELAEVLAVVTGAVSDLMTAVDGVEKVPLELKGTPVAGACALLEGLAPGLDELLGAKETVPEPPAPVAA